MGLGNLGFGSPKGIFSIRRTLKTLRDQELCVAVHLFAEEVNTGSDLV